MIRIKDIAKSFDEVNVLKGITHEFYKGQNNLIIGRSGAGKTVLLKILIGLITPSSGEVWYGDTNFYALGKKEVRSLRMKVGMLFQGSALFDSMTVEENVRFPLDMFSSMTQGEKDRQVQSCLDRVDLMAAEKKYPSEISGGMMKRVGIARAIVLDPKYLFCDEPNSGLDPKTAMVIDSLISEITKDRNITTVINTHDMNSVMEIGDNILLLHNGRIAWTGHHQDVIHSDNEELQEFIFASPFLKKLRDQALKNA